MITRSEGREPASRQPSAVAARSNLPPWQRSLQEAFTDLDSLLASLDLDRDCLPDHLLPRQMAKAAAFPLRVTRSFANRMRSGDPEDPLLRQVLPLAAEDLEIPGFVSDPVGDLQARQAPGLLSKYRGRVLLVVTGSCAIHCRYCFRREFPYSQEQLPGRDWSAALETIAADSSVSEVILSGGDPLSLRDERLARLAEDLASIPHVQRLRLHTRLPVVLPERVDEHLLAWLRASRLQTVMVLHVNHAREIDREVGQAMSRLGQTGLTLLNQAVLLRGVNDCALALRELSETLFGCGVLPYYLHLLDPVRGAAHFEVPAEEARQLMRDLASTVPGYLVPKLVQELPGAEAKTPLHW